MNLRLVPTPAPDWTRANCIGTDPEAFYPLTGQNPRRAKRICSRCDIKADCLEWAIETNQTHGVWGGVVEQERTQMIRARKAQRRAEQAEQVAA